MSLFDTYRQFVQSHKTTIAFAMVAYAAISLGMPLYLRQREESMLLKQRVAALDRSLAALSGKEPSRIQTAKLFRNLEFKEQWQDDKARAEILRLIDYARFAEEKADYEYASRFYEEANKIQETHTVTYFLGRDAYLQGELTRAEMYWRKILAADPQNHYPEMRLYLALILYEQRKDSEAASLLEAYVKARGNNTTSQRENAFGDVVLSISDVVMTTDPNSASNVRFNLRVAIKAHPNVSINHKKVKIQVFFYDTLKDREVVLTDADVSYEWITAKHDWSESNPEILVVTYARTKIREGQKYLGYVVRVYYSEQLQAVRADPERLLGLFPPPLIIPDSPTQ